MPLISWAGAGRAATNITAAAVSSDKPLWINFRFIVFSGVGLSGRSGEVSLASSRRRVGEKKRRSASAALMAGRMASDWGKPMTTSGAIDIETGYA